MKAKIWLGAMLLAVAGPALAGGSVQLGLQGTGFDIDSENPDPDVEISAGGIDLRAAFEVNKNVFLRGQYSRGEADEITVDGDDFDADFDFDILRLGIGYRGELSDVRLYGVVEYLGIGVDIEDLKGDDKGFGLSAGIGDLGKGRFLWNVEISLLDVEDTFGNGFDATIGYRFTPAFAGVIGLQGYGFEEDDVETVIGSFSIGARFTF